MSKLMLVLIIPIFLFLHDTAYSEELVHSSGPVHSADGKRLIVFDKGNGFCDCAKP